MHGFSLISQMNIFCEKSVFICVSVAKNMFYHNHQRYLRSIYARIRLSPSARSF